MQHARDGEAIGKLKVAKLDLSKQATQKVSKYNSSVATRYEDVIHLGLKQRGVVKGKGKYWSWLPSVVLRTCFGDEAAMIPDEKLVSQTGTNSEPLAMSTTVL